jgi:hypothetical protein
MKPRVFIGSSQESTPIAYAIQENLERFSEVTVWDQGIFEPSTYILDTLTRALNKYDFGIFVFSGEDVVRIRDKEFLATRDNVLFELGLFMGHFGKERTFVMMPLEIKDFRLPTDLLGLNLLTFSSERQDGNLRAALGPACNRVVQILRKFESEGTANLLPPVPQPRSADSHGKISIDLPEFIMLLHNLGLPQAFLFLGLTNSDESLISISRIHLMIRHEDGRQICLRARSYIPRQPQVQPGETPQEYPVIRVTLRAGDSWIENTRFYSLRTASDQAEIDDLARQMQATVGEKKQRQEDPNQLTEVSPEQYSQATTLFDRDFSLTAGKYQGVVAALSTDLSLQAIRGFGFELAENSVQAMKKTAKDSFLYGSGVYYSNNNSFAWCRINSTEDSIALDIYKACDPKLFE